MIVSRSPFLKKSPPRPEAASSIRAASSTRILPLCIVALCGASLLPAQSDSRVTPPGDATSLPSQPIGANDLLNITVYGVPTLSRPLRVLNNGDITLPMVADPIRAQGLFPQQLEPVIAKAYQEAGVLVDPVITVNVTEYQSRPITVSGAVKNPLTFQAVGRVTLLEAIARANGLTPDAGPDILVTYPIADAGGSGTGRPPVHVSAQALIAGTAPDANFPLTGGEDIRVPPSGKVFVLGNVKKPGAFRAEDPTDTSVLKVLAMSEGLTPFASKVAYVYRNDTAGAAKTEIPIELRKIIDRKQPDVTLQANDILYVPDDRHRRITVTTLERLATFGAGTASGIIIWR